MVFSILLSLVFSFVALELEAIPSYQIAEKNLLTTWENSYPVNFSKVIKKNPTKKGILEVRDKKGVRYIYTFLVFVPRVKTEDGEIAVQNEGKEVFVKLYFDPKEKEKPYSIRLGEFEEKYFSKSKIRWIAK